MVKITTMLIGIVLFSIVATMMFGAVVSILDGNPGSQSSSQFVGLSAEYENFGRDLTVQKNSTLRQIKAKTDQGPASSVEEDIFLVKGAISGGRLGGNFFANFDDVINTVSGDTTTYIDPRIFDAMLFIISLIIILAVLHYIRGAKLET